MGIIQLGDTYQNMLAFIKEAGLYLDSDSDALSDIEIVDWAADLMQKLAPEIKKVFMGTAV